MESFAQEGIVEMRNRAPKAKLINAAFRNKAMDVGVPFEVAAKGVKDTNETRDEMARVVEVEKETREHLINGRKEQIQKRSVDQEKRAQFLSDGEDAVAMGSSDKFEGHSCSSLDGVEGTAGRTKSAAASERDELGMCTLWATIKRSAERRIAAVDHLFDVFHFNIARMASIFNFFVMVAKDLL